VAQDPEEFRVIELCAGYGGLGIALAMARPDTRIVCAVENEGTAAEIMGARIEDAMLDDFAIWSDARTFDGRPWRGRVHCITAGYPCQPFSAAGKRRGAADPRHLWPHVLRIIEEVEPLEVFLENVDAHLSLGFFEVAKSLRDLGYRGEAGIFSAEEVGAPHRRKRLFALFTVVHTGHPERRAKSDGGGRHSEGRDIEGQAASGTRKPGEELANGSQRGRGELRESPGPEECRLTHGRGSNVANGESHQRRRELQARPTAGRRRAGSEGSGIAMDDAGSGRHLQENKEIRAGRLASIVPVGAVSDASGARLQAPEREGGRGSRARIQRRATPQFHRAPFPPGPDELEQWAAVLKYEPRVKPAVCGVAHGTTSRVDRLRALGNGVVPIVGAYAYRTLRAAHDEAAAA
jgi:DNA (cytosine-5)-methyltransferase 1